MKIHPVGDELFHTDMKKLTVPFCNFANNPKNLPQHQQKSYRNWPQGQVTPSR